MSMAWVRNDGDGRLRVSGELLFESVMDMVDDQALDATDLPSPLIVDLSGVERADSAALALLVEWHSRLAAKNIEMQVQALPAGLQHLLEIGGLDAVLNVRTTES